MTAHTEAPPVTESGPRAGRAARTDPLDEVTFVITNYNGRGVLEETLGALGDLGVAPSHIVLSDDGSTDGSAAWVATHYAGARIVVMPKNSRHLNAVRNRGLRQARTRYVLLMDNDILVLPGCVAELMRVMRSRPGILCCTPRLLDADDPERIYQDGATLHFLGLSANQSRGAAVSSRPAGPPTPTFGGGIMLIDRDLAGDIGLFDESYALGWADDGELHLRARLAGYEALHVPTACCLHHERERGRTRAYAQFYNRYRLLLSCYATSTLLLLSPALLAFELALTVAAFAAGTPGDRLRAVRDVWRDRVHLVRRRRSVQRRRRVSDAELLGGGVPQLPGVVRDGTALARVTRAASAALDFYWRVVRALLRLGHGDR
jgi:GT2 family glycosyltransferase